MKNEIRVLGIDDAPFYKFGKGRVLVIGVVMRGGKWIEGVMSTKVNIDGINATKKIASMVVNSKFMQQIRCIFIDGIAVGGLNIIDINELHRKTKIPVVVVIRKYPDLESIRSILAKLKMKKKIKLIERAGKITQIGKIFVQFAGADKEKIEKMLGIVCTRSHIPESLRLAHLIAAGVIKGESSGRA